MKSKFPHLKVKDEPIKVLLNSVAKNCDYDNPNECNWVEPTTFWSSSDTTVMKPNFTYVIFATPVAQ
jgi:hypothetical protein